MKKEIKKLLAIIFAFVFVFTAICVSASAENLANEDAELPEDTGDVSPNIFETFYRESAKHADKIFSLLAFITSLTVAFGYRKTLLPVIKGALTKLGSSLNEASAGAEKRGEEAEMRLSEAKASFEEAKDLFKSLAESFDALCLKLDETNKQSNLNRDIRILLKSQIDMLYEVFISSSLPVYQKEAVGERISEMKKTIADPCGEEE